MNEIRFRITALEPQKHSENRVNVFLDGAFAFGLDRETVLANDLHEGDEITEHTIDNVLLSEERVRAKNRALGCLSRRAHSIHELAGKLRRMGFSERTIARVVDDFSRVGLLNDGEYAKLFASSQMSRTPVGKRLLRDMLKTRGIEESLAGAAVEEAYGQVSETDLVRKLVRKRMPAQGVRNLKEKKKMTGFLFRRGFDWDTIRTVLDEVGSDDGSSGEFLTHEAE
jgi:regulatory protein